MTANTTLHSVTEARSTLSGLLARGKAQHGLPVPMGNEGDPDCYPNPESETGP
ncbi:MAG: hypothetical protein AAF657_02105 [Acidobacteriota bacterium]